MIRKLYNSVRSYWRIYLLVFVTVASMVVIFSPVVPGLSVGQVDPGTEDPTFVEEYTGIQFNIELGGGTRVRAPLIGYTAEDVVLETDNIGELETDISENLGLKTASEITIRKYEDSNTTIELTKKNLSKDEFENALSESNIEYSNVRSGLTPETRSQTVRVLQNKIDSAGLSGGSVREVELDNGRNLILVEVPNIDRQDTLDLISSRGEVRIDIYYYDEDESKYTNRTGVLTRDDFRTVGSPQQSQQGQTLPNVPVTVEPTSAEEFQDTVVETNVAKVGGSTCQYERAPDETESCLLTVVDGEVVYSAGMSGSLASSMRSETWSGSPNFILQTDTYEEAQELSVNLDAGALPANLDIESGEISFISPTQGEEFRLVSFIIAIIATLTVALNIGIRYGKAGIALPMILTALSEVVILIAIAVLLSYPIDIAVVAGLIAVIGTGVDDLIIIADRVIGGENPAHSSKVFENRFRSALWIIIGAAGTTILAIGPLAVLDLRQLQGFAIFTIIGVIVGVLLTRPSYGDILRYLYTDR